MDRSAKYWSDIATAIAEIETFVVGIDSLNAYVRDVKTKRAVWPLAFLSGGSATFALPEKAPRIRLTLPVFATC